MKKDSFIAATKTGTGSQSNSYARWCAAWTDPVRQAKEYNIKVLLINIALRPGSPLKLFPTGFAYVASAIVRAGFDVKILDIDAQRYSGDEIDDLLAKADFDVAALGCIVTGYKFMKDLTAKVRRANPEATIIVGNSVGSSIPKIALTGTEADVVVMGEGDITAVELLQRIEAGLPLEQVAGIWFKDRQSGKVVATAERPVIENIDTIPQPMWELFDMETYIDGGRPMVSEPLPMPREEIRPFQVNTARGCLFKCTFCYHNFRNRRYRTRSPESIVSEMSQLKERYDINYVHFWDELTFYSIPQAGAIIDALLEADLGLYWTADVRGNMFMDDEGLELAKRMKQSGCIGLGYSLESANKDILKMMEKKIEPSDFIRQKRMLDQAGLASWTSLVFGYPQETQDTIKQTLDCCREAEIYPSAGYLLPQPGTPMYEYAQEHGFVGDEEEYLLRIGDRQDLHVNLTSMTNDELVGCVEDGLKDLNRSLQIGLDEDDLIKTLYYRKKKEVSH